MIRGGKKEIWSGLWWEWKTDHCREMQWDRPQVLDVCLKLGIMNWQWFILQVIWSMKVNTKIIGFFPGWSIGRKMWKREKRNKG